MSKYNNEQKKYVIENHKIKEYYDNKREIETRHEFMECDDLQALKDLEHDEVLNCAHLLSISQYRKQKKVRQKIKHLIATNNAYFITLTFNDTTLAQTSQETRRRYVARYLKERSSVYVANIDFGKEKGREHYHAVSNCKIDLSKWGFGFSNIEKIRPTKDPQAIAKYITKLSAHAYKDTTQKTVYRLIYSRNVL